MVDINNLTVKEYEDIRKDILARDPGVSEETIEYMLNQANNNTIDATELFNDLADSGNNHKKGSDTDVLSPDKLSVDEINALVDKMPDKTPI